MFTLRALDLVLLVAFGVKRIPVLRWIVWGFAALATFTWLLPPVACTCIRMPFRRCATSVWQRAALRSDLKNLASQQEIFFSDWGSYSADPVELGFVPTQGVRLALHASPAGWSAWAEHEQLDRTEGCGIFVGERLRQRGSAEPTDGRAAESGEGVLYEGAPGEIVCTK